MYQPLVPCPSCSRHVRALEAACPFCAAALPGDLGERAIPGTSLRLTRAAVFVFGASIALTACSGEVSTASAGATSGGQGGGAPDDDGGVAALYGFPAMDDAGTDAEPDAPDDSGGFMGMYGNPPPEDAG